MYSPPYNQVESRAEVLDFMRANNFALLVTGTGGSLHGSHLPVMVVERELRIEERPLRCGYVENVATAPALHGRGIGSVVMRRIGQIIADDFEIGSLATGSNHFYERLGWETWRGPCFARRGGELFRTADHDGDVMVLRTAATPAYTGDEPISVAWRRGELW